MSHPVIVLKFGSSIFKTQTHLASGVHEIYRWIRRGRRVVAVVSAFEGVTDSLIDKGRAITDAPTPEAHATLLATGELTTAALLSHECSRAGISSELLSPNALELRTTGEGVNADPGSINIGALRTALHRAPVVIVPGFVGVDEHRSYTLLGRGGSDLTAIFIAAQLGHAQCRLVKDVDGLYERDPALPGPAPRRFASLSWDDALTLDGGIIQHKAIRFAKERSLSVEVAALQREDASIVQRGPVRWQRQAASKPVRVGLLGCGVVGGGVLHNLRSQPDYFDVTGVFVRSIEKAERANQHASYTTDPQQVVSDAEVVVELLGGIEPALSLVTAALTAGKSVVTANKALIAQHGASLEAIAALSGASLRYSAAVGGVVPMIESIERIAASSGVASIEGVVNGTCNYVLNQVAQGTTLAEAVCQAQRLGYAEADPTRDLDGTDSLDKLIVLARKAYGADVQLDVHKQGLGGEAFDRLHRSRGESGALRLVASTTLEEHRVVCRVEPRVIPEGHPLHVLEGARNRLIITGHDLTKTVIDGAGAGRWPTSESVLADLFDSWRHTTNASTQASTLAKEVAHAQ